MTLDEVREAKALLDAAMAHLKRFHVPRDKEKAEQEYNFARRQFLSACEQYVMGLLSESSVPPIGGDVPNKLS